MRWWRAECVGPGPRPRPMAEARNCLLANWGSEIRSFQDLHTHLNRRRDFTGSLARISSMSSNGMVAGGGGMRGWWLEGEAEGSEGGFGVGCWSVGGVRMVNRSLLAVAVVVSSSASSRDDAASFLEQLSAWPSPPAAITVGALS